MNSNLNVFSSISFGLNELFNIIKEFIAEKQRNLGARLYSRTCLLHLSNIYQIK